MHYSYGNVVLYSRKNENEKKNIKKKYKSRNYKAMGSVFPTVICFQREKRVYIPGDILFPSSFRDEIIDILFILTLKAGSL